jgi:hypothetical protein
MLTTSYDADAWRIVKPDIRKTLAKSRNIDRAGWLN